MSEVSRQSSPPKGVQSKNPVKRHTDKTEQSQESQTSKELVPFLSCPNSGPTEIQETEKQIMTTLGGDSNIPLAI